MSNIVRVRRGLAKDLPKLRSGELAVTLDDKKVHAGGEDGNFCVNPDPDKELDSKSDNSIANSAVKKSFDEVNEKIRTLDKITNNTEYGMRWIEGASEPQAERCARQFGTIYDGEATGLTFSVNEDGSFASSYDNLPIWGEIRRVTIQEQVMVEIPRYYILEEVIGVYHYVWVCKVRKKGYRVAAIFERSDGKENKFYYIGAYEAVNNHLGESKAGYLYPSSGASITKHREAAQALGDGWGITTIAEVCDFWQVIMPIEFGTRDVQSVANGVTYAYDGIFEGSYDDIEYRTGMSDDVENLHGIKVVATSNESAGLDGINCGLNPFIYRGIENPYGCLALWVDGLTMYNKECYTTNDRTVFKSNSVEGYTKLGYEPASQSGSNYYVKALGYDENAPYCRLPIELTDTSDTYYADYWYINKTTGYRYACWGGNFDDENSAGAWYFDVDYSSTRGCRRIGARLSYSPV